MDKRTRLLTTNRAYTILGTSALLAGTALVCASAVSYKLSEWTKPAVTLSAAPWSHLTNLKFGSAEVSQIEAIDLAMHQDSTFPEVAEAIPFKKPTWSVRRAPKPHSDRIKTIHAAPAREPSAQVDPQPIPASGILMQEGQPPAEAALTMQVAPIEAPMERLEAFQQMHRQLRQRFFVAVQGETRVAIQNAVTTQLPAQVVTQQAPLSAKVRKIARKRKIAPKAQQATVAKAEAAPLATKAVVSGAPSYQDFNTQTADAYREIARLNRELSPVLEPAVAALPVIAPQITVTAETAPASTLVKDSTPVHASQAAQAPVTTQLASAQSPIVIRRSGDYSAQKVGEYSLDLYQLWQAWQATQAAKYNEDIATPEQAQQGVPTQPLVIADAADLAGTQLDQTRVTRTDSDPAPVVPHTPSIVEAFEWKTAVEGTHSQVITLEGWHRLDAAEHWPVIYWNPDGRQQAALISSNTAVMLSKFADAQLQSGASIVFGKVPAGWEVEYSDRTEKVVYLNDLNQLDGESRNVRYFAFVNAAPGAQLVTLKTQLGAETAAVAAPVMAGVSTFLDLTEVTKRTLSGHVYDAGSATRRTLGGVAVSVVGQPSSLFFTTESGYFRMTEVYAVGSYPMFVETSQDVSQGFKHRYRLTPDKLEEVSLFRFGEDAVFGWLNQLEQSNENPVSADSGMIVAAMPTLTRQYGDGRLFPVSYPLLEHSSTLTPETYVIEENGSLEGGRPLTQLSPRFVSVQVPSGPVISQIEDNNHTVVWSQLVLAQKGVINVVGPY